MIGYETENRRIMRLFTDEYADELTAQDVARRAGLEVFHAGKILAHLKKLGLLVRIKRNRKWTYSLPTGPGL